MQKATIVAVAAGILVGGLLLVYVRSKDAAVEPAQPAAASAPQTAPEPASPVVTAALPEMTEGGVDVTFTTSDGPLLLTLWPKLAPKHVQQVLRVLRAGIYDDSVIFRVEKNFVVQFGGTYERPAPLTPEQQAVVTNIPAEFSTVKHERGIVSMARQDDPNSADTSFSILLGPAPHLDGKYTVFGRMSPASEATLRKLEAEPVVGGSTHPVTPIKVLKAEVGAGSEK